MDVDPNKTRDKVLLVLIYLSRWALFVLETRDRLRVSRNNSLLTVRASITPLIPDSAANLSRVIQLCLD